MLVLRNLYVISVELSLLYLVKSLIVLPDGVETPLSILAATTGMLLIGLRWILGHWSIPPLWAHLLATSIFGLLLLNSLIHLRLTAEPWQITNLMFLVIVYAIS